MTYLHHPDPVVEWSLNNAPVPMRYLRMLESQPEPRPPKVEAIYLIRKAQLGLYPMDLAIEAAEKAYHADGPRDLHILLLIQLIYALCFHVDSWCKVGLLVKRLRELLVDDVPIPIKAWALVTIGAVTSRISGIESADQIMLEAISLVPPDSDHYPGLVLHRYLTLLQQGRGAVLTLPKSIKMEDVGDSIRARLRVAQFINYVHTGYIEEAIRILPEIERPLPHIPGLSQLDFEVSLDLLGLMLEGKEIGAEALQIWRNAVRAKEKQADSPWVTSTRHLLKNQAKEALRWARIYVEQNQHLSQTHFAFDEYTLIRAELANHNNEAARMLLRAREEKGTTHYMDKFFWMRVELLSKNADLAGRHRSALTALVKQYDARARLDLELSLACELTPSDLLMMSHSPDEKTRAATEAHRNPRHVERTGIDRIVFSSPRMASLRNMVLRFADVDAPVLITGETGTGKELIAQALHESGSRRDAPFLAINCSAMTDTLVESELFGYKRGAFTGAQISHSGLFREAGSGTLFLDEIGDISPKLQVTLLRVLESRSVRPVGGTEEFRVSCRVVAATNANLVRLAEQGTFRKDLLYRLYQLEIPIPPLRERPEDIITIASYYLDLDRPPGAVAEMSPELKQLLLRHPWSGNVRELRNMVWKMRLMSSDKLSYEAEDCPLIQQSQTRAVEVALEETPLAALPEDDFYRLPAVLAPQEEKERGTRDASAQTIDALLSEGTSPLRRLQRLRRLFREHETLRVAEVAEILAVSNATASRYLQSLQREEFVKKITPNNSPRTHYYVINKSGDNC